MHKRIIDVKTSEHMIGQGPLLAGALPQTCFKGGPTPICLLTFAQDYICSCMQEMTCMYTSVSVPVGIWPCVLGLYEGGAGVGLFALTPSPTQRLRFKVPSP